MAAAVHTIDSAAARFGPVIPFKDENYEVLQGNDTTYGAWRSDWTRDISRAYKVARALKAGSVWVNCHGIIDPISPFGGYKESGFGRELGRISTRISSRFTSSFKCCKSSAPCRLVG